jgi:sugar phosphate isomerase/epimerase
MTGDLDWKDIMDALEEVGYDGYYNMELNLGWFGPDMMIETAAFAIKVMRNILKDRH